MAECRNEQAQKHCHGGKSSERLLDKQHILACLAVSPGQVVLDAGCGNGYMAKEFAELTGETGMVHALDPDTEAIDILKSEVAGRNIRPFVGDITQQTPLEDSSIDLVYVSTVLHGFSETQMEGFRNEVTRLLKPSGRLAVLEIKKEETPFGPPLDIRFSPDELKAAVQMTPVDLTEVSQYFYLQVFEK